MWSREYITKKEAEALSERPTYYSEGEYKWIDKSSIVAKNLLQMRRKLERRDNPGYQVLSQINVDSSDGTLQIIDYYGEKAVLKKSKDTSLIGDFTSYTEAAIGLLVINNLRTYIPNFMMVLDYVDESEKGKHDVGIILEYVEGEMLSSYCQHCSASEFKMVLLLIFNALNLAYTKYKFTHGGLHYNNIIINVRSDAIEVPIYDRQLNVIYYVTTKIIPIILDYGKSSIAVDDLILSPSREFVMKDDDQIIPDNMKEMHIDDCSFLLFPSAIPDQLKDRINYLNYLKRVIIDPRSFDSFNVGVFHLYGNRQEFIDRLYLTGYYSYSQIDEILRNFYSIDAYMLVELISGIGRVQ